MELPSKGTIRFYNQAPFKGYLGIARTTFEVYWWLPEPDEDEEEALTLC